MARTRAARVRAAAAKARASTFGRDPRGQHSASTLAVRGSSGSRRQSRRSRASWWHRAPGSAATPCRATRGTRAIPARHCSSRTCFGVKGTVGRRHGEAAAPRSLGAQAEIRASVQSSPEADGAIQRDCAGGARELQRRYRWAEHFQRASSAQVPAAPTDRFGTTETHRCNGPRRTTIAKAAAARGRCPEPTTTYNSRQRPDCPPMRNGCAACLRRKVSSNSAAESRGGHTYDAGDKAVRVRSQGVWRGRGAEAQCEQLAWEGRHTIEVGRQRARARERT